MNRPDKLLSSEEIRRMRDNKSVERPGPVFGSKKVNADFFYALMDTAEYHAQEADARKWDLINIHKRLAVKIPRMALSEQELLLLDSDSLIDRITDMLVDL